MSSPSPALDAECVEAEKRLQAYVDRQLTTAEVELIEAHLETCDRCSRCYQFEPVVWERVKQACSEPCPETLKKRLRNLCAECGCED